MKALVFCFVLFVLAAPALRSQSTVTSVSACKPADIDVTFSFSDIPIGKQSLDIDLHNTMPQPCGLRGQLTPSFAVDGHGAIVKTCWFCTPDGRTDSAAVQQNDAFVLPGEGIAHVAYQWSSDGDACQKVDWIVFNAKWQSNASFLFESTHWKPHVCSTMQISGYQARTASAPLRASSAEAVLQVTLLPKPLYADEFAQLTLQLKSPHSTVAPTGRCPELYAIYSDGPGSVRFEAIEPDGYGALVSSLTEGASLFVSGDSDDLPANLKGYTRLCDTKGKVTTVTATLPASLQAPVNVVPQPNVSSLRHIVWRAENPSTHERVFVDADTYFEVLDPSALPANWGPQVKGIGAGLSIDRVRFTLGEPIPLHLYWENFSAPEKLGVTECGDPRPQLEVQDASRHVLGLIDVEYFGMCNGHGWGPFAVEVGKTRHTFRSLTYQRTGYGFSGNQALLTGSGVYYLVAVWSPSLLVPRTDRAADIAPQIGSGMTFGKIYATARSLPVRIEILPGSK